MKARGEIHTRSKLGRGKGGSWSSPGYNYLAGTVSGAPHAPFELRTAG